MGEALESNRSYRKYVLLESFMDRLGLEKGMPRVCATITFAFEDLDEERVKSYLAWVTDVHENRKTTDEFRAHLRQSLSQELPEVDLYDLALHMLSGHAEPDPEPGLVDAGAK